MPAKGGEKMENKKKPGWKEWLSNRTASALRRQALVIAYISVFMSGISLGISIAKILFT